MRTIARIAAALVTVLLLQGCSFGVLYTHTREPLTLDQHATSAAAAEGQSDIKHVQFPYVGIMWGNAALGDIAREKGLQELYYADLEFLSVLTVWRQYTVHLYGR